MQTGRQTKRQRRLHSSAKLRESRQDATLALGLRFMGWSRMEFGSRLLVVVHRCDAIGRNSAKERVDEAVGEDVRVAGVA